MKVESRFTQHKGLRDGEGVPNSLEALLANYRGSLEADAVLLSDGTIAIVHGRDIGRQLPELEKMNIDQLEEVDIGTAVRNGSGKTNIPLLREFVGLATDAGTAVSLELKASSIEKSVQLAESVARELLAMKQEDGMRGNERFLEKGMVFESFSTTALHALKAMGDAEHMSFNTTLYWPSNRNAARTQALFDSDVLDDTDVELKSMTWEFVGVEVAFANGFDAVEYQPDKITQGLVEYAHTVGIEVNCGLVTDEKEQNRLFGMGVDHILI